MARILAATTVASLKWRKSTYSGDPEIGTCVELAPAGGMRGVRDSKNPDGPALAFSVGELRALLGAVKNGDLDL
ncbi:DUF397 domain-containing protein [Actinomadura parmotrematis]|uniref:DUF397 domain-containing protein n=1 Tax=Actinomadura parmotrematis TaxID=2864039 RepID=A0ABS7G2B0_9ACTN|nr:DUF397 domain-containing protein [Actinomadura parmotrematis]MBW8486854.1 DUF397 domain-containing protein [Actinomadura parmotrematis]